MPAGTFSSQADSKAWALTVNGVDVLPWVPLDEHPVRWTTQAANGVGSLTFTLEDTLAWANRSTASRALVGGADVRLRDLSQPTPEFGGVLLNVRHRVLPGHGRLTTCAVASHDWWLDHRFVPTFRSKQDAPGQNRRITRDRNMVAELISRRLPMLEPSWATISETNDDMPLVEVEGVFARQALEEIADAAETSADAFPRRFYVDAAARVHYFKTSEGVPAPYVVGDGTNGTIVVEDLEYGHEWADVKHHVYVRGKNAKGSGWVYNTGPDFARGAVSHVIDRPKSDTVAKRNRFGRAFLRRQDKVTSGSFKIQGTRGWRAGQVLTVTEPALGLSSATFLVAVASGELERGAHPVHRIEFGAPKRWITRDLRRRDIL